MPPRPLPEGPRVCGEAPRLERRVAWLSSFHLDLLALEVNKAHLRQVMYGAFRVKGYKAEASALPAIWIDNNDRLSDSTKDRKKFANILILGLLG